MVPPMAGKRCKLCNETVADSSMFCDQHRAQAQVFADAFAPDEDPGDPDDENDQHANTARMHRAGAKEQARVTEAEGPREIFFAALARVTAPSPAARLQQHVSSAVERAAEVLLYYCRGRFIARQYFSILAHRDPPRYALDDPRINELLQPASPLGQRIRAGTVKYDEGLREGSVEHLCLRLDRAAGRILLLAQPAPQLRRRQDPIQLSCFEQIEGRFAELQVASPLSAPP